MSTGQKLKDGPTKTLNYTCPRPGTADPVPELSDVTRVGKTACAVGHHK
jgi:hypothetical protein